MHPNNCIAITRARLLVDGINASLRILSIRRASSSTSRSMPDRRFGVRMKVSDRRCPSIPAVMIGLTLLLRRNVHVTRSTGCNQPFPSPSELHHHHQSHKHRGGQLRGSCLPAPPSERAQPLPPLPDQYPAYMTEHLRVGRHPMSKERHRWVALKVSSQYVL